MNVTLRYTQLGLAVAALLDKAEPLDAGQAQQYIEDGSLFSWLGQRYDGEIDLSRYEADDQADVLERFQALSNRSIPSARSDREQRPGPAGGLLLRGLAGNPLLQRAIVRTRVGVIGVSHGIGGTAI